MDFAKCECCGRTDECCGRTEECTPAYIVRVLERYSRQWVRGLGGEAVKEEIRHVRWWFSMEEALRRHMSFSREFRSASPLPNPVKGHIATISHHKPPPSPKPHQGLSAPPHQSCEKDDDDDGDGGRPCSLAHYESCFPSLPCP
ncbi:uncharacterized protein LOC120111980 [Phoenix dactylifera]|uniref:Uncharacterized protein LOC120111980 n=1 Tax=Phoenix dactylifera TaxID=42345 RepID=A0A8B9AR43_PHODC|nr:uncharacterized protein LOC120111980 [Phoenix dactylifera]